MRHAKLFLQGEWVETQHTIPVFDKFSGEQIGSASRASREQVNGAVSAAGTSFRDHQLSAHCRATILTKTAALLEKRRDEIAQTIIGEAGFPMIDASNEVARAAQVLITSAEEGKRLTGEMIPIEAALGHEHRMAFTIRVPRGVVCGITSFNSPLNMIAHKVAPALASGNTIVLKPPQTTPFSAVILVEALLAAGLPPNHIQLLQGGGAEVGGYLIENQEIAFYTFTGSTEVGKLIREKIGLRPSALELGSIAATIVHQDADLERAALRVANSGFRRAGQACTSTQRLFVHQQVLAPFTALFKAAIDDLPCGDPRDPKTIVGPMISEKEALRAESWVREALDQGATLVHGNKRQGSLLYPTVLTSVRPEMRVLCEEIFAPVLSIIPYTDLDSAIAQVNATPFGLAAGIFTRDVMVAMSAARKLHMGVVHVNEPSTSRVDMMPFSGVKQSGLGREGPKYAMQEMTEERLITMSLS